MDTDLCNRTPHANTHADAYTCRAIFPPYFSAAVQSAAGHMTGLPSLTEHAQTPQCCQAKYKRAVRAEICNR